MDSVEPAFCTVRPRAVPLIFCSLFLCGCVGPTPSNALSCIDELTIPTWFETVGANKGSVTATVHLDPEGFAVKVDIDPGVKGIANEARGIFGIATYKKRCSPTVTFRFTVERFQAKDCDGIKPSITLKSPNQVLLRMPWEHPCRFRRAEP